jgi:pyruvate dehydrogenase E2 component (dihydrolipoamide acetyltransferase)
MSKTIQIKVPDIGGSSDVNVAEVYVKVGDKIKKNDNLLMLETDKATMEVPSEYDGEVINMVVKVGDKINEGDLILTLNTEANEESVIENNIEQKLVVDEISTPDNNKQPPNPKIETIVEQQPIMTQVDQLQFITAHASPSIRKLARELGVDLSQIKGSGTKGRITESDVKSFIKTIMSNSNGVNKTTTNQSAMDLLPWPKVDFAKYGEIEIQPLTRIKKLSGANLARNWVMIPHVTQFDEANITEMEDFRKQLNQELQDSKITPLAFLIKACVHVLKLYPEFNSSLDGDNLIYKKYYHIGFAADTPQGLVVPVLKDADKKGLVDIAKESSLLAKMAREGKLKPQDMQGSTFTISSLGGIGGTNFTPIINAPEVAILGVSKSIIKPIWNGKDFTPQLMLPLALSYDHRVIDGALAAKFTTYLAKVLTDIRRLVI